MKYLIILFSLIVLVSCIDTSAIDEQYAYNSILIGETIIIQNDTLEIINRNILFDETTLSNGIIYSDDYILLKIDDAIKLKLDSITNHYDNK